MTDEDGTVRESADGADGTGNDPEAAAGSDAGPDDAGNAGTAAGGDHESLVARVAAVDEELAGEVGDLVGRADDLEAEVAELDAALDDRESEIEALTERLQRTQADFQNYKKRAKKRQERLEARATEDLVERLLDVRDDLRRALADDSGDVEALRDGVELTLDEFDRVLGDEGVEEVAPEPGEEVDPNRHEVLMRVESDRPEGTVAEVYRPGYEMDGRVVRTAQVTVSDGGETDGDADDRDEAGDGVDADDEG